MRGRTIIGLLLIGFTIVASGIIWRRGHGIARDRQLRALATRKTELEAEKTKLENDIREASSRARLAPLVEQRLQMRIPNDTQVVILPKPRRAQESHATP